VYVRMCKEGGSCCVAVLERELCVCVCVGVGGGANEVYMGVAG